MLDKATKKEAKLIFEQYGETCFVVDYLRDVLFLSSVWETKTEKELYEIADEIINSEAR